MNASFSLLMVLQGYFSPFLIYLTLINLSLLKINNGTHFVCKEPYRIFFGAKIIEVMIEIYPLLDRNMGGIQEYQKLVTPNLDQ